MSAHAAAHVPGLPREGARAPARVPERILGLFRAPRNVEYLAARLGAALADNAPLRAHALAALADDVHSYACRDLVRADARALEPRGGRRGDLWAAVRRLNGAFLAERLEILRRDVAPHLAPAPEKGLFGARLADESYQFQAFAADSLAGGSLELGDTGPVHGSGAAAGREGAAREAVDPGVGADDRAWRAGDGQRTAAQAEAEYWGEGRVASDAPAVAGPAAAVPEAFVTRAGWGAAGRFRGDPEGAEAGDRVPVRLQRYTRVKYWQHTARPLRAMDRDIEENLGHGRREAVSHVRGWNLAGLRVPRKPAVLY